MVRTAAALALAAGLALAQQNAVPPTPLNSQLGKLHFPVTCKLLGFLNQTFDTVFTATAPVYGGSGQQIYYTDVTGLIDVPSYITGLAPLVKAKQATANITVYLKLTNASPATLLAYQDTISNIPFSSSQDAMIRIPVGNGTLAPIGPVTLGQAGVAHRIFLGDVAVSIDLLDATGKKVFGPIPVKCGAQNINYVIGSVNVDSTTQGVQAPKVGYVPSFQPTPAQTESGYFRFPYNCNFGPLGPQNLDITIGGTIPTYFKPGQQFSLTNSDSFLRVPTNLITLAKQGFPKATTFQTNITDFEILFSNASPSSFNVAKTPIISNVQVPATVGSDFIIPIPVNGLLTVGPITAGSDGTIAGVSVGQATATTSLLDASGNVLFSFPVTCNVPAPLELIGVPITSQAPGNYKLGIAAKS